MIQTLRWQHITDPDDTTVDFLLASHDDLEITLNTEPNPLSKMWPLVVHDTTTHRDVFRYTYMTQSDALKGAQGFVNGRSE